ncbi:MAG: hypothetical protein N2323_07435, partial [candidate division WOR-3 bacterium]|nr:hypothetical protein [candidate division WOR-3 bacterium]
MKVRVLFLGLLVFSFLFAGGRKVIGKEVVVPRMRMLSAREIMREILQKFPEMVPDWCKDNIFVKGDTEEVIELFPFSKVEGVDLLQRLLPNVNFYKGINLVAMYPYFIAISGTNKYKMPQDFNRLILDNGLEVTDKNILELAKMFVILAVGSEPVFLKGGEWGEWRKRRPSLTIEDELLSFPQITFLEGRRSIDKKKTLPVYRAFLKVKVGDQTQIYSFRIRRGQIEEAKMNIEGETVIHYFHLKVIKISPKRGELDLNGEINIVTTPPSDAYVEWEKDIPHYYLIVKKNNEPTGYCVQFHLSGFQPNQQHIVILVRSINSRYADTLLRQPVAINSNGEGSFLWVPSSETTCITKVWAIDTISGDTTLSKKLTLEKVLTGRFSGDDSFWVYYTDQFFINHPQGSNHSLTFAQYVKEAAIESWQKQVVEWDLGLPPDANRWHKFFINNNQH